MNGNEPNSKRYAPPAGYYDRTADRPLSDFLAIALALNEENTSMTALDFGCGGGCQLCYHDRGS